MTVLASGCIGQGPNPTVITGKTVIDKSGIYVLEQDISCPGREEEKCISVSTDDVVLDCQGHSITGGGGPSMGVFVSYHNHFEVRNCRIERFMIGIETAKADHGSIIGNQINNNRIGIYLDDWTSFNNYSNNIITSNGKGISIFMGSHSNTFSNNTIRNNDLYGIEITCNSHQNFFYKNTIEGNGYGLIENEISAIHVLNSYGNIFTANRICNNTNPMTCEFDTKPEGMAGICTSARNARHLEIMAAGKLFDGGNNVCEPAGLTCEDILSCNAGCD